ncbi:MAG: hypothetical protein IJH67_02195 [Thermoguttaceae bacterium]|nr:hypothetical protein [Thermoguttaceae bacterium]
MVSSADFVRDPKWFSAAALIFSGTLDKAAASRRSPRRKRSSIVSLRPLRLKKQRAKRPL